MGTIVAALIAVVAALSNGLSAILQRLAASRHMTPKLFEEKFIAELFRSHLWLAGAGFDILGFLLQAAALGVGSLIIVEPVMTVDLIFMLIILAMFYKVPIGKREWLSAVAICLGLSSLLITSHPVGGHLDFDAVKWVILASIVALMLIAAVLVTRRLNYGHLRAAFAGVATGANFAFTAGLTKLAVDILTSHGAGALLTSWELYAMIASAAASMIMIQNTYGAGSLVVSQPALAIANPLFGVVIGIVLFGDRVDTSALNLGLALLSALVLAAGVFYLSGSKAIIKSKL